MANVHSTQNMRFFKAYADLKEHKKQLRKMWVLFQSQVQQYLLTNDDRIMIGALNLLQSINLIMADRRGVTADERSRNNPFFGVRRIRN